MVPRYENSTADTDFEEIKDAGVHGFSTRVRQTIPRLITNEPRVKESDALSSSAKLRYSSPHAENLKEKRSSTESNAEALDSIDWKSGELQHNGRTPYTELGRAWDCRPQP